MLQTRHHQYTITVAPFGDGWKVGYLRDFTRVTRIDTITYSREYTPTEVLADFIKTRLRALSC